MINCDCGAAECGLAVVCIEGWRAPLT